MLLVLAQKRSTINNKITINVEFVLALPQSQTIETKRIPKGTRLKDALPYFQLNNRAREIIPQPKYGIFNQIVSDEYELKEGDRIEVYRPLIIDPKQARKIRAERKAALNKTDN